jgi:hypothetical protein
MKGHGTKFGRKMEQAIAALLVQRTIEDAAKAPETPESPTREGSKSAAVLALIQRAKGATLAEIMEATSWQAHSVRGFISGTLGKKMGLKVESAKREDGTRFYSIAE